MNLAISTSRRSRFVARAAATLSALAILAAAPTARSAPSNPFRGDLEGARILYATTGGLAAIEESLRVFDDGSYRYEWRRGADAAAYEITGRLPAAEVASLKRLFLVGDFESMPPRFAARHEVMDGVRILVKAKLLDGSEKSVFSETLAVELPAFASIRRTLEGTVADVRAQEVLRVRSYAQPFDGRERHFALLGDGRYRVEFRRDGLPVRWSEGWLRPAERNQFLDLAAGFDFSSARLCEGTHVNGAQHDVFVAGAGRLFAMHFSEADPDQRFECLTILAERIDDVVKAGR
jgi:hypothetical protein